MQEKKTRAQSRLYRFGSLPCLRSPWRSMSGPPPPPPPPPGAPRGPGGAPPPPPPPAPGGGAGGAPPPPPPAAPAPKPAVKIADGGGNDGAPPPPPPPPPVDVSRGPPGAGPVDDDHLIDQLDRMVKGAGGDGNPDTDQMIQNISQKLAQMINEQGSPTSSYDSEEYSTDGDMGGRRVPSHVVPSRPNRVLNPHTELAAKPTPYVRRRVEHTYSTGFG